MKLTVSAFCVLFLGGCVALCAQEAANTRGSQELGSGRTVTPNAGVLRQADIGLRARAHYKIFVPPGRPSDVVGFEESDVHPDTTPVAGYYAETPASLACIYGLYAATAGCNPYSLPTTKHAVGGSKAIAIVDAYHYPTAMNDLAKYSALFGLPAPTSATFTVVAMPGVAVDPYCSTYYSYGVGWNCWEAEEALDIEMAHAMAPSAHIYLVEAKTNSYADLFAAVNKATALVQAAGGGEVSMSWGGGEGSGETAYDVYMNKSKVVYFASTGDSQGTEYPSVSPNVVAVGGTTINRSPSTLNLEAFTAWEDGGGGISKYEARPAYQAGIATIVGTHRGVPDVAAIANPRTGVWVYDSYDTFDPNTGNPAPWNIFGGTSVAAPLTAALVNNAGHFAASSATELATIYAGKGLTPNWYDTTYGTCGYYQGWFAVKGWDPCTGWGQPYGRAGK